MWGKFFYNVSFAISTISGCYLDDNGMAHFLGIGNSMPIIMTLDPKDGSVKAYMNIDKIGATATSMPWYATYGAIYYDMNDADDGRTYWYISYISDDIMQLLKIDSQSYTIKWNYQAYEILPTPATGKEWMNKKIPGQFHQDPADPSRLYLFGMWRQRAAVIKFDKKQANVDWRLEIKPSDPAIATSDPKKSEMNEIYSYTRAKNDFNSFFLCGYKWIDPTKETFRLATTAKISSQG